MAKITVQPNDCPVHGPQPAFEVEDNVDVTDDMVACKAGAHPAPPKTATSTKSKGR